MLMTRSHNATLLLWLLPVLFLAACGGDEPRTNENASAQASTVDSPDDDAASELAAAFGAGQGGGTLTFDGKRYTIDSALCYLDPPVEVSTVGEGYRVLIQGGQKARASILDPDSVHWTHVDWTTTNFTVTGSKVTSDTFSYRNNKDEQVVEASFEIECP